MNGKIRKTSIPGLLVIEKPTFKDARGYFREVLRLSDLKPFLDGGFEFKQWSHSYSKPRVIRALHTEDQNKLVYPITGKMFAAYVDTRTNSDSFGKVVTITFSEPNGKAVLVPKGIANSICVIGNKPVHYIYLIDEYYEPEKTKGIAWDDPDLAIDWPVMNPVISDRDKNNPTMRELYPEKFK